MVAGDPEVASTAERLENGIPIAETLIEETRKVMGDNFWSYGIKGNEKTLNALFRYSHEQRLTKKRLQIADLFCPSTLDFTE